jgi:hypothetical protein
MIPILAMQPELVSGEKCVLNQRELNELLAASNNATNEFLLLLDGITQKCALLLQFLQVNELVVYRQMHRELKLQHALRQQIAHKIGVSEQATSEMRQLIEEAPEGAPVAALLPTPPLTKDSGGPQITLATAEAETRSSSERSLVHRPSHEKSEV